MLDRLVKQPGSREDNRLLLRNLKKEDMLVKSALNTNVLQKYAAKYKGLQLETPSFFGSE